MHYATEKDRTGLFSIESWLVQRKLSHLKAYWGTKPLSFGGAGYTDVMRCKVHQAYHEACFPHPVWIPQQCHGSQVQWLDAPLSQEQWQCLAQATDGVLTSCLRLPIGVLTADCVPVLLACREGRFVGAVHAGWRGVANRIVPEAVALLETRFSDAVSTLEVYLGASAQAYHYRVDTPVIEALVLSLPSSLGSLGVPEAEEMYKDDTSTQWYYPVETPSASKPEFHVSLHEVLTQQLIALGVSADAIVKNPQCTIAPECHDLTWSHRRGDTERMLHSIWLDAVR